MRGMQLVQFALGLGIVLVVGLAGAFAIQVALGLLQQGGEVADAVNVVLLAALGALGYLYRSSREKRVQLEERLAAAKRELYQDYVDVLKAAMAATKEGRELDTSEFLPRLRTFAFSSILIASDPVVRAHIRFMNLERIAPGDSQVAVAAIGDVLVALRRDIGFPDTKLTSRQILGVIVSEIDIITEPFVVWDAAKPAWDKKLGFEKD